jgi:hypothetical protein
MHHAQPAGPGDSPQFGHQVAEMLEEVCIIRTVPHVAVIRRVHIQVGEGRAKDGQIHAVRRQVARHSHAIAQRERVIRPFRHLTHRGAPFDLRRAGEDQPMLLEGRDQRVLLRGVGRVLAEEALVHRLFGIGEHQMRRDGVGLPEPPHAPERLIGLLEAVGQHKDRLVRMLPIEAEAGDRGFGDEAGDLARREGPQPGGLERRFIAAPDLDRLGQQRPHRIGLVISVDPHHPGAGCALHQRRRPRRPLQHGAPLFAVHLGRRQHRQPHEGRAPGGGALVHRHALRHDLQGRQGVARGVIWLAGGGVPEVRGRGQRHGPTADPAPESAAACALRRRCCACFESL